ncbi:hypothetical protein B0J13DRAFT_620794 [Dactylonectria estremocensis]|uniref:RING-type domain-containing protein n=1 Tax=Dactylonectria estremocensis TaxID=1079267 RepID=A0A9P9F3N7_9HYPO|nr:hypothetical protein B0J13DRAFT_620794 [Dactylonectria estremocensis]
MDDQSPTPDPAAQEACIQAVVSVFPDVCLEYLDKLAGPLLYDPDTVITYLVDLIESGTTYTRRRQANLRKRKRDEDDDDDDLEEEEVCDAKRRYGHPSRAETSLSHGQMVAMRRLITGDFPLVSSKDVTRLLTQNGMNLLPTYLALYKIVDDEDQVAQHLTLKKRPTGQEAQYRPENIDETIANSENEAGRELLKELRAARLIRASLVNKKNKELQAKEAEEKDYEEAKSRGLLMECECCFTELPENRLVHCDAELCHWFCMDCARRNAETLIGLSKYEMTCMSMDGCEAGFCQAQRIKFLDKKLTKALDRIEQEAVLRMAGIDNLASCPFCPFAAEYPSIEINREFRCENPTCQVISCRLCEAETHLPKTCAEAALENGVPARRGIEEAMSSALIRKCNKCNTPFIKESGCNKMRCPREGCRNNQCYVCSKSCDYAHFNDVTRGGKAGNCPLFDVTEKRHEEEIQNARNKALKVATENNPGINAELLNINMSDKVAEDDERKRRQRVPQFRRGYIYGEHELDDAPVDFEVAFGAVGARALRAIDAGARMVAGAMGNRRPPRPNLGQRAAQILHNPHGGALEEENDALIAMVQGRQVQIQAQAQAIAAQGGPGQAEQAAHWQAAQAAQFDAVLEADMELIHQGEPAGDRRVPMQVELEQMQDGFEQMMRWAAEGVEQVFQPQLGQQHDLGQRQHLQEGPNVQHGQIQGLQRPAVRALPIPGQQNPQHIQQYQPYRLIPRQRPLPPDIQYPPPQQQPPPQMLPQLPQRQEQVQVQGDDQQNQQQAADNNRPQDWLERLQGMNLGFGAMQDMNFGRTFLNNDLDGMRGHPAAAPEAAGAPGLAGYNRDLFELNAEWLAPARRFEPLG